MTELVVGIWRGTLRTLAGFITDKRAVRIVGVQSIIAINSPRTTRYKTSGAIWDETIIYLIILIQAMYANLVKPLLLLKGS